MVASAFSSAGYCESELAGAFAAAPPRSLAAGASPWPAPHPYSFAPGHAPYRIAIPIRLARVLRVHDGYTAKVEAAVLTAEELREERHAQPLLRELDVPAWQEVAVMRPRWRAMLKSIKIRTVR